MPALWSKTQAQVMESMRKARRVAIMCDSWTSVMTDLCSTIIAFVMFSYVLRRVKQILPLKMVLEWAETSMQANYFIYFYGQSVEFNWLASTTTRKFAPYLLNSCLWGFDKLQGRNRSETKLHTGLSFSI